MVRMDAQSEWILLRRVYALLRSRNLKASAYALAKEARLDFDTRRLHALFMKGKWRRADEYVSAFMRGKENTPDASGTLFPIRLQRLVRTLKRGLGHRIWALRYHFRHVSPLLVDHPDRDAARAEVDRAMRAAEEGITPLYKAFPDGEEHRRACFVDFLRYADENGCLLRCTADPLKLNIKFMNKTTSLTTTTRRRYTRRRRSNTHATQAAAGSPSQKAAATT